MSHNSLRLPAARIAQVGARPSVPTSWMFAAPRAAFATLALSAFLALATSRAHAAPVLPPNFIAEDIAPGANFNVPTCIASLPDGRVLVGEKQGRVWAVKNGVKNPTVVWDRQSEVLDSYDRGLLSVAVDPNYFLNHYLYFLYTVDPDSNNDESNVESFGRLTRYQVNFTDSATVVASSRTILLGVDWPHGPVEASQSHTVGALRWGTDGSLLVSVGDGADFTLGPDQGGLQPNAFLPGRTDPAEDIGAYRAQYIKSLDGKVLRLNPATGQGYASNPLYDGNLNSVRSKIWAYGFRNPYRFCVRPGTGVTNPASGNPGVIYLGDVGWNDWEEMDVIASPSNAFNAGWPCYEGPVQQVDYWPLSPSHVSCDSLGTSPDDPKPASMPTADWHHRLDYAGDPPGFIGNCSTGGIFYSDTLYPAQYRGKYFHGDYGQNWIRMATMTSGNALTSFDLFGSNLEGPVDFAREPGTGNILYVSILSGQVRRIRYTGAVGGDTPPVAVATSSVTSGLPPLDVDFDGTQSSDADGDSLTWTWLFGDGTGSTLRNPSHTYTQAGSYLAILTVADGRGGEGRDSIPLLVMPVTPFPSTPVIDNFNRANGPLGAPWTADVAGLSVQSNALVQTTGYGFPIWDGDVFGPDQEAYVTFKTITGSAAPERDLVLKAQGTTSATAHIEIRFDATLNQVDVGTYDTFNGWLVQGAPIPATFAAGDRFGARAYGNGLVEVYKNATKLGSRTLLGWPYIDNGGRVGMTIDAVNKGSFDDFGGGDIVFPVNHPPVASITSPADSSFYFAPETLTVHGTASDPDEPASNLTMKWDVFLHHNTHIHFGLSATDQDSIVLETADHDDGSGVYYEVRLIATDTGGLADTTSRLLFPEADLEPAVVTTNADHVAPDGPADYEFVIRNHGRLLAHISRWRLMANTTMLAEGDTVVTALDSVVIHRTLTGALAPGTYTLRAVADTLASVVETNENNNASVRTLVIPGVATAVDNGLPATLALSNPYPNPTRNEVAFALALPRASEVSFDVLDLQGRVVWNETPRRLDPGRWTLGWNGQTRAGSPAPSGLYLARVRIDGQVHMKRMALLR